MEGRYSNGGDDGSRNRITLLDAIEKSRDRRTLETILSMEKQPGQANRTLLDIIRDEESGSLFGHRDKKSWKAFRDKLRLKRAGSAWTSSVHTPTSDIPIPVENRFRNSNINNASSRSLMTRRNSVRFTTVSSAIPPEVEESDDNSGMGPSSRPQMTRRSSTRFGSAIPQVQSESTLSGDSDGNIHAVDDGPPSRRFRPQISRHNSTRFPVVDPTQSDENDLDPSALEGTIRLGTALAEERLLSAREAVAAQEAAEAAAQAEAAAAAASEQEAEEGAMPMPGNMETQEPVRMSLMDLLEETDRQMGFEGSRYTTGDLEACDDDDDDDDEEGRGDGGAVIEYTCCVCMVRHKVQLYLWAYILQAVFKRALGSKGVLNTVMFNSFVFCQSLASTLPLSCWQMWMFCVLIGAVSMPIAVALKLIPVETENPKHHDGYDALPAGPDQA
uniref:Cation-transporting P-type ATPase C-terminal domain-containing protein n=1 Tax=Salix viminalis TaxID=40686 RepID=A0A6N2N0A5_SALVM